MQVAGYDVLVLGIGNLLWSLCPQAAARALLDGRGRG